MFSVDYNKNPFIVIWEVTRACQLECLHCRAEAQHHRDPLELTFEEGKKLMDEIYEMGNPIFVLTGGDPLERPDIFEIAKYAKQKGIHVSLAPAATANVTKEVMQKAKDVGLSRWAFSLDGHTAEIHDRFRGISGPFDLTMKLINYLHELGMPIQINTTISRYNYEYLDEMAEMIKQLHCVLWSLFFLIPTGRGKATDMISPAEHEKVLGWLYKQSKTVPFDIKTTEAQFYRRVVIQNKMREKTSTGNKDAILYEDALTGGLINKIDGLGRGPKGVNAGNGYVFISHTGDVFPSGFLPLKAGNVRQMPLATIYRESEIFRNLRNPDAYKGKCGVCEFRYVCGGSRARAYSVTGDYMESEPNCVYIPKAWRDRRQGVV